MSSYTFNTTGRTSSQSSIYDYPEHLNPFYVDENHKRLRFWHFGGHRSDKPRSERRGSLVSIRDGLRDMWEFKTFRLKKKRSSSLGINKTSESPPPLRREEVCSHYNTISNASPYRNTINTVGYTQSNTSTPLFERHSRYRTSLQERSQENGIGFTRNDRYRSTVQNGFATYGGGSMVTSTPRSRFNVTSSGRGMTAGVSQTSLKSTNPFEEDEENDSISLNDSFVGPNGTIRQSLTRPRKKRRAPPPPVPKRSFNTSIDEKDVTDLTTKLIIEEPAPTESSEDIQNLTSLTAEIESFVKTSNDDINCNVVQSTDHVQEITTSSDTNNNKISETASEEKITVNEQLVNDPGPSVPMILPASNTIELHFVEEKTIQQCMNQVSVTTAENQNSIKEQKVEEIQILDDLPQTPPPQPTPRSKPSSSPVANNPPMVEDIDIENLALPETPVPARRHNKNRTQNATNETSVLRITESSSDSITTSTTEEEDNMQSKAIKQVNYEFQYKVEPIKTEIDEKIGTARLKISESTCDVNASPHVSAEPRRSVRDIIESINKSQSLLKVNHDSSGTLYSAQSNDSVYRNLRELNERERDIQRLLQEMDTQLENQKPIPLVKARGSYYDNVPEGEENTDNLDDSNNLLSKSDFRSKKSPTKSLGIDQSDESQFQDCIDWNPLPKPRRSRHFPEPANQSMPAGNVLTSIDQNSNINNRS